MYLKHDDPEWILTLSCLLFSCIYNFYLELPVAQTPNTGSRFHVYVTIQGPSRIAENRITETGVFVKSTELPK